MTQFDAAVEEQKEKLKEELKDKQVVAIDTRYKDTKWSEQTISYASGRSVTEFSDRRKKTEVRGG